MSNLSNAGMQANFPLKYIQYNTVQYIVRIGISNTAKKGPQDFGSREDLSLSLESLGLVVVAERLVLARRRLGIGIGSVLAHARVIAPYHGIVLELHRRPTAELVQRVHVGDLGVRRGVRGGLLAGQVHRAHARVLGYVLQKGVDYGRATGLPDHVVEGRPVRLSERAPAAVQRVLVRFGSHPGGRRLAVGVAHRGTAAVVAQRQLRDDRIVVGRGRAEPPAAKKNKNKRKLVKTRTRLSAI